MLSPRKSARTPGASLLSQDARLSGRRSPPRKPIPAACEAAQRKAICPPSCSPLVALPVPAGLRGARARRRVVAADHRALRVGATGSAVVAELLRGGRDDRRDTV